ncbi:ubiquitin carboxyl-terminal hydrolase 34 [Trichoderma asperellum]
MAPVPEILDALEPKTSPEPSSTRPNPFDDSDVSSRKRRRTSASGSPSASVETGVHRSDSGSSPFSTVNTSVAALDDKMKVDQDAEQPRTPPQRVNSPAFSPEPPTSSRVTINLRNAPYSDSTASPSAPQYFSPSKVRIQTPEEDQVQKSIEEEADLDLALNSGGGLGNAQASPVASPSPPVEVIAIQEDDSVAEEVELVFDQALLDSSITDPTMEFPYHNTQNSLLETSNRLRDYVSSQSSLDPSVFEQVRDWLDRFLAFANQNNSQVVLSSLRQNKPFWLSLPNVIDATISRQHCLSTLPGVQAIRVAVLNFYHSYLALTAQLVMLDCQSIQEWQSNIQPHPDGPLLFVPGYLHQLHRLKQYHEHLRDGDFSDFPPNSWGRVDPASYFIYQLQTFPGGSIESLGRLATAFTEVVSIVPRLADILAPIAQVLVSCLQKPADVGGLDSQEQLRNFYNLWKSLSSLLGVVIDRHVGYLTKDRAASLIEALGEMLRICLPCGHEDTIRLLEDHQAEYPDLVTSERETLSTSQTAHAIAWEWRTDMLAKLIRSTQMQLRVMAIEIMSNELVDSWRRLGDRFIDPQAPQAPLDPFLDHQSRYLLRINLVDYLIGPNCHPELMSGSTNIIGFLVVTKMYNAAHTDRLWQGSTESQDPRVARALTELTSSVTNLLDRTALLSLCEKFRTLPIQDFNQSIIFLWGCVLKELVLRCQKEQISLGLLPYELCLRLLREALICTPASQSLYPEVHSEAMARLDNLVAFGIDDQDRQKLYSDCVEDMAAKSPTTLGSLCFLQFALKGNVAGELNVLIEQFDFARLLVEELEYAIHAGRAAGMPMVLSGTLNRPRRDFIAKVIRHRPDAISGDLGKKLWNLLVGTACLGEEDRNCGWGIFMAFDRKTAAENPFLQLCYSQYLPDLPTSCFCRGMLNCVNAQLSSAVNDNAVDCALDDQNYLIQSGLEQLWRIILYADDAESVSIGIKTLAVDVYLDSKAISTYPFNRARQVHSSFVDRCLGQLKDAARKIKASSDGTSSGEDEPMVIVTSEDEIQEQERIFTRTLRLLKLFVETHYTKPALCAPDFRPFAKQDPKEVQGDLTMLQYQSFDDGLHTEMKPLHIGKLNTAASLLSSLKLETGFDYYRVFYQGRQFLPTEEEICRSLDSLDVNEGLILVRREEDDPMNIVRVKPGASPIEIQILSRFQELWTYLGMEDAISKEIYSLLIQLPTDGGIIDLFESPIATHTDIFPPRQPYKSLYIIRALTEYIESIRLIESSDEEGIKALRFSQSSYEEALRKSYSLIVQAISNESFLDQITPSLQIELMEALMATFVRLLQNTCLLSAQPVNDGVTYPSPSRLVDILSYASGAMQVGSESLIDRAIAAILRLCLFHNAFMEEIATLPSFTNLLKKLILLDPRSTVRKHVVEMIKEAVETEGGYMQGPLTVPSERSIVVSSYPLTKYAWSTITSFLSEAIRIPSQCHEFFGALTYLLYRASQIMSPEVDTPAFAAQVCELLLSHNSTESLDQPETQDVLANDLLSILLSCLQVDETLPVSPSLPDDIVQKLFWRHLFPKQRTQLGHSMQKVLLNANTRQKLYEVILRLAEKNQVILGPLFRSLNSLVPYFLGDEDGHYIYDLPYQFNREKAIKPCGYVGLRNLSNTCYLNALLTQLFMNTQFRRFILSLDIPNNAGSQQLLFHAQKLLAYMQESPCRFVDPEQFVGSIRTYEDTYIDINSQMDVDEFYNLLFDRLEAQLLTDDQKRKLRGIYGGQLVQQIKSRECTHVSERFEPFSAIQCDINGKRTLQESLEAYVGGEIMEGDNKYKCSSCDRHVDAVKRACLKDVPDNLIFHLKRFDFSLRTLQRSKINDYFSFPRTIDMRPYTIDYLSNLATGTTQEDIFELVGILVHSGTAESGHYYSFIRERTSTDDQPRWFEFNDDNVSLWDPRNMANHTFGGPSQQSINDNNGTGYTKNYSGYMLFYQRASALAAEQQQAISSTTGAVAPVQVEIPPHLKDHILSENTVILKRHCLFDPNYITFVESCFAQARLFGNTSSLSPGQQQSLDPAYDLPHGLKDLAMEVVISHLDQLVTRAEDTPNFKSFSEMIRRAVIECGDCAIAFFEYFSRRHAAFRMLVQRHPDAAVRTFSWKTLILAMEKIAIETPNLYDPLSPNIIQDDRSDIAVDSPASRSSSSPRPSVLEEAVLLFDHLWRHFHFHLRSWDEVFGLLLDFARMGPREVAYLLANDYLLKLLRIIAADTMMELPLNYARMLNNIFRRVPRPPSYAAILALIDYFISQLEPMLGAQYIVDTPEERLNRDEAPFPWTADEVQLIHSHPERQLASFFIEKLLAIDQARPITHSILGRLTTLASQMDLRILNSLRKKLEADSTMQPMDPFLRAAAQYLESTQSAAHSRSIIRFIAAQAQSLQNSEPVAFLEFFSASLNLKRPHGDIVRTIETCSLETLPDWVPHLLAYGDCGIKYDTERFLDAELFDRMLNADDVDEDDIAMLERRENTKEVIRRLGMACVFYLRDTHVKQRAQIGRDTASMMVQVAAKCTPFFSDEPGVDDERSIEFNNLQREIANAVRTIIVDEVEDDNSDWEGSYMSSDPLDCQPDLGIQQIGEPDEALAT